MKVTIKSMLTILSILNKMLKIEVLQHIQINQHLITKPWHSQMKP